VFYSDCAGPIINTNVDSTRWSGVETHHYGYLFLPQSGSEGAVNWQSIGVAGTYGAVVDRPWISTNGADDYVPSNAPHMPARYALNQNFPNPFNPTTTIEFALPQSSEVNLTVFDLSDRVVAELVMGKFNARYHSVNFDASNLSFGTNFFRIKAGDFVGVKKATLLK
jgi:hypothetical protein